MGNIPHQNKTTSWHSYAGIKYDFKVRGITRLKRDTSTWQ